MTKLFIFMAITMMISADAFAHVYVHGHVTRGGTYVQGHQRTYPDGNKWNNWATKGSTNPYTGKAGTK